MKKEYQMQQFEPKRKFMQVLDKTVLVQLRREARKRGVTVQEVIRTIIIPDWLVQERDRNRFKNGKRKNK